MPFSYAFVSQANISSVFGCQELVTCFIYVKLYSCLEDNVTWGIKSTGFGVRKTWIKS